MKWWEAVGEIYPGGGRWGIFSKCGARWENFIQMEASGEIFSNVGPGGENLSVWWQVERFFKTWDSVGKFIPVVIIGKSYNNEANAKIITCAETDQ